MNKYFIQTSKTSNKPYSSSMSYFQTDLVVEVNLNTYFPNIEITFDKLKRKHFAKPTTTEYHFVKPTTKDEYTKCLHRNLELIRNLKWGEAEYFLISGIDSLELKMFTLDDKREFSIGIKISNDFEYGTVEIGKSTSFTRRRWYRNNGEAISEDQFRQVLELVYNYVLDEVSYEINISSLEAKVKVVLSGEMLEPKITSAQKRGFLDQLEQKKRQLQARLIDNDSDTPQDRASLRGELAGIEYAIRVYELHFAD